MNNVTKANKHLAKAKEHHQSAKKKMCCLLLIGAVVIAIILGTTLGIKWTQKLSFLTIYKP